MNDISIYSPVYKEIKKLEREAKEAQFDGYVNRFSKILIEIQSAKPEQSYKDIFEDLHYRYLEARQAINDFKEYSRAIIKINLGGKIILRFDNVDNPKGLTPYQDFIYNAFSIYGPKKLREALDL